MAGFWNRVQDTLASYEPESRIISRIRHAFASAACDACADRWLHVPVWGIGWPILNAQTKKCIFQGDIRMPDIAVTILPSLQ